MKFQVEKFSSYLTGRFVTLGMKLNDYERDLLYYQAKGFNLDKPPTVAYWEAKRVTDAIEDTKEEMMFIQALIFECSDLIDKKLESIEVDPMLLTKIGYMESLFDRAKLVAEIDSVGRRNEEDYRKSL